MRLIAISVDGPEDLERMRAAAGASFEFLSDPEGRLMDIFQLRHRGASPMGGGDLFQTATFLLAPDGRVLWRQVAETWRQRPKPKAVLAAIDRTAGT